MTRGREHVNLEVEPAEAVRVFSGALALAGEMAQRHAGHYAATFATENGQPLLAAGHVLVGVPDQSGSMASFGLRGVGRHQHNILAVHGPPALLVNPRDGAYRASQTGLQGVAVLGEPLSDPHVWRVHDNRFGESTEYLCFPPESILPITARLWTAIGHGIMRGIEAERPAGAHVTQRFDSGDGGTLYNQSTGLGRSALVFETTRLEDGVANRFEMTLRPISARGDMPAFVRTRCSLSATYPAVGGRPFETFKDSIQQIGDQLEVVRTHYTGQSPESQGSAVELGRAPASGETMYQLALAAVYAAPLPDQVGEWGV